MKNPYRGILLSNKKEQTVNPVSKGPMLFNYIYLYNFLELKKLSVEVLISNKLLE